MPVRKYKNTHHWSINLQMALMDFKVLTPLITSMHAAQRVGVNVGVNTCTCLRVEFELRTLLSCRGPAPGPPFFFNSPRPASIPQLFKRPRAALRLRSCCNLRPGPAQNSCFFAGTLVLHPPAHLQVGGSYEVRSRCCRAGAGSKKSDFRL